MLWKNNTGPKVGTFSVGASAPHLKCSWIDEALTATGRASQRIRMLPARFVVWLVNGMALFRKLSIQNVLLRVGAPLGGVPLWTEEPADRRLAQCLLHQTLTDTRS